MDDNVLIFHGVGLFMPIWIKECILLMFLGQMTLNNDLAHLVAINLIL